VRVSALVDMYSTICGDCLCIVYLCVYAVSYFYTVWEFLLGCQLPYCGLYDEGYTSLGNKSNTVPNLDLLVPPSPEDGCKGDVVVPPVSMLGAPEAGQSGSVAVAAEGTSLSPSHPPAGQAPPRKPRYLPAYMLRNEANERSNRRPAEPSALPLPQTSGSTAKPG
jgi:hypothetical protein